MSDDRIGLIAGERLGDYVLLQSLGAGGQAAVWSALDPVLKRQVALKILPMGTETDQANVERLRREGVALAQLNHPNVLPILHWGEAHGRPFIVLPLLSGGTLDDRLASGEIFSFEEASRLLRDIASALAAAHAVGIIHRDIKPSNVLLDASDGRAVVADFGIAQVTASNDPTLTEAGLRVGTLRYMSPERRYERGSDRASGDIYSLGLVADQMLGGAVRAGQAIDGGVSLDHHRRTEDIPAEALAMLQRTLSANPDERPSASEIVEMLDAEGGPTKGRLSDWLGRRSRLQQLFLLLMAITTLGIIGLLLPPRAADDVTAILLKLLKLLRYLI